MATAFVKAASYSAFGGPYVAGFSGGVTAGDGIAVWVCWYQNTITLTSITDTQGNTYTLRHNPTTVGTAGRAALAYAYAGSTGVCSVTANFSSDPVYADLFCHEISGVDSSSFDQSTIQGQTNPGTGADAVTSGNVTTTGNGEYIFGGSTEPTLNGAITQGTGFTSRSSSSYGRSESLIQTSAGSIAATFTSAFGASGASFLSGIMTFKEAGGGGATRPVKMAGPWGGYAGPSGGFAG